MAGRVAPTGHPPVVLKGAPPAKVPLDDPVTDEKREQKKRSDGDAGVADGGMEQRDDRRGGGPKRDPKEQKRSATAGHRRGSYPE